MSSNLVSNFLPNHNGLRFINYWPENTPHYSAKTSLGDITIGDAHNGLCGGMVFTVVDFFEAGLQAPTEVAPPEFDSPLYNYIVRRLYDSFNLPTGFLKYYEWMTTPEHDSGIWLFNRRGVSWSTVVREWPKLRAIIDSGHPCPIGLVTMLSVNPRDLGNNHQVLAYGYDLDENNNLTLHLYDPNTLNWRANDVRLSVSLNNPSKGSSIVHNVNIGHQIRGFFVVDYSFSDPSGLLDL